MYWTLELASYLEDAPWPASKDELIDFAIRTGAPLEVVENLQELEDDGQPYESIEEIWPDIEKLNSELRFYVAGKSMPQQFYDYDSDNLVVEGEVFDAVEFMNSKAIMIVPLLSGSGMRVKIIEGMAMKKCVIATTYAAEGLNCENGKDILIADTADEFYRCILQCLTHPNRWREIGENARKTVERDHDLSSISRRMLNVYQQLVNG